MLQFGICGYVEMKSSPGTLKNIPFRWLGKVILLRLKYTKPLLEMLKVLFLLMSLSNIKWCFPPSAQLKLTWMGALLEILDEQPMEEWLEMITIDGSKAFAGEFVMLPLFKQSFGG